MTEIPSCILSHICGTMRISKQIKPLFNFYGFPKKKIHYVSQLFNGSINNGMNLRENTIYKRIIIFNE